MKKLQTIILVLSLAVIQITQAQVIVNQSWVNSTGQPDTDNFPLTNWNKVNWSNSTLNASGNLITVGNTVLNPGNADILITKFTDEGQVIWQQTFDGQANGYDYGVAVISDAQDNVYVAGATSTTNSLLDFTILKYNSQGILQWSSDWSGSSNLYDIPTAIAVDNFGNVAVVGITVTTSLQSDLVVQKYSSNGTLVWTALYDKAGLNELPVLVGFDAGGEVSVRGFTSTAAGSWSFADLKFSGSSGFLSSEDTKALPGISIEDAVAVTTDSNNNIYIAGSSSDIENKNFEVIKINSTFDVEWANQYEGKGLEDLAKAVVVDSEDNIIVSGNSVKPSGGKDILTIKIASTGQEIWRRSYMAPVETGEAWVAKMQVSQNDEIFLAGTVDGSEGKDYATFMYDRDGSIRLEQIYDSGESGKDVVSDLQVLNGDEIYITGTSTKPGNETLYTTVKYNLLRKTNGVVLEGGKPHHRSDEVIVKFLPQFVDTSFVDDRTKRYGDIHDVLPTNVVNDINQRISTTLDRAIVIKIFHRLSTSHTSSLTRLGDTIPMPEFWSTFLLYFPPGEDMETLTAELGEITDYIVYAHPNHIYQKHIIPNDNFFNTNDQQSLFDFPGAVFPDVHINVEPAWDWETGQDYTKVGVFDDEIFWGHDDFGDGTFAGSQIKGGWDFVDNISIKNVTNPAFSHGTACAGIIGALRDNGDGIAGIAGGGMDAQGNDNPGVQLFSLAVSDNGNYLDDVAIAPAIQEGAMFNPAQNPPGYGLHVMNASWGGYFDSPTLENALEFTFNNQVLFVASKGNDGTDAPQIPSDINDIWVLSVGASGTNGEYKDAGALNGDGWITVGSTCTNWTSNFGNEVDVVAPGVTDLVTTLINPAAPFIFTGACTGGVDIHPAPFGVNLDYQNFSGTSAAAPHVAGIGALMHSLHHVNKGQWNNLAPEDYEFLLQRYADDIGAPNFPIGYDQWNGWGRINAAEVLERLEAPFWRVFHSGDPVTTNQTTAINQELQLPVGIGNLAAGIYYGERVQVTSTYLDIFSPTTQIVDSWERLSSTIGVSAANPILGTTWADFDFVIQDNVASVTTTTHTWHITSNASGQNLDVWIPAPPTELRTAYSLHLHDPNAVGIEDLADDASIRIFPNPSMGNFSVEYELNDTKEATFYLFDLTGKVITSKQLPTNGYQLLEFDLTDYPNGLYLCQIVTEKEIYPAKLVKQ